MDRNTIERIRALVSPPRLIGTIMDLIMTLIRRTQDRNSEAETAVATGGESAAPSPGPPFTRTAGVTKKPYSGSLLSGDKMQSRLDREQWSAIQLQIGDPQKFVEAVQQVPWEDGLSAELANLIEDYLSPTTVAEQGSSTASGETQKTRVMRRRISKIQYPGARQQEASSGITLAAAKHASADAAVLMAFVIAILDYHHCYVPYKSNEIQLANLHEKVNKLEEELQERKVYF